MIFMTPLELTPAYYHCSIKNIIILQTVFIQDAPSISGFGEPLDKTVWDNDK